MKNLLIISIMLVTFNSCKTETQKKVGIFDKFKKETPKVTSDLMGEDQFWSIIETSLNTSKNLEEHSDNLTKYLSRLTTSEIIGFHLREQKLRYDSYTSELWCAGYIMNGGCSDDSFEYFRCWLIAHGKEVFYSSLKSPDSLAKLYSKEIDYYDFEDLMYVASTAFENKTGKELDDFVDYDNFKTHEGEYPDFEFTWEEDNVESMQAICPELMKLAWN